MCSFFPKCIIIDGKPYFSPAQDVLHIVYIVVSTEFHPLSHEPLEISEIYGGRGKFSLPYHVYLSELQLLVTIEKKNKSKPKQFFTSAFYYTLCLYYTVKVSQHFIGY